MFTISSARCLPLVASVLLVGSAACDGCRTQQTPVEATSASEGSSFEPFVGATPEPAAEARPDVADAVATIDGVPVMGRVALDERIADLVTRYERLPERPPTGPEWRNERRRRLVRSAVHDALVARHLAAHPIPVSDEDVHAEASRRLEHVWDDARLFERFLHSRSQTREEFLAEVRGELEERRLLERRGALEPTDEAVRTYYEGNLERWREEERARVRGVTVRLRRNAPPDAEAEALARATAARQRIAAGEPFAAVALDASDAVDRLRGGDMGWVVRGRRRELQENGVEAAIFGSSPGTLTDVIRTEQGFQFFEVLDRRPAGIRELDELADLLREPLRRQLRDRVRLELVAELERDAEIVYHEENWGLEDEGENPIPAGLTLP